MILTIQTDKPEAELTLYDADNRLMQRLKWQAHRALAATLHGKITELLSDNKCTLKDLTGIVVYQGPGSFTGVRIGVAAANALAGGLGIPIIGMTGADWQNQGMRGLRSKRHASYAVPVYDRPATTTLPKK